MQLPQVLLLAGLALLFRGLLRWSRGPGPCGWVIFAASVIVLYWLQPSTPVRGLDFWLPTATLALAALGWLLTAAPAERFTRENGITAAALAGLVLLVGLTRYIGAGDWLQGARPPAVGQVLAGLALLGLVMGGVAELLRFAHSHDSQKPMPGVMALLLAGAIVELIALLVVLKTPELALLSARGLRALAGQNPALATTLDIRWLGFSYVCFRLIHTLRDRQTGRLPAADLRTYTSYVIFFPSIAAGPIDRLERFQADYCQPFPAPGDPRGGDDLTEAARRLVTGLFKKFALADTLALIALSGQNAAQVREAGWLWLLVYAYALVIYLDFSGYTDIAIGLGRILGVRLPENFAAPYFKPNLGQFWASWHMSLTQWFRAYYFNPLVRWLRGPRLRASAGVVVLVTQVTTMLLIGLWHGVTWNFVLWGLWHGLGMYVQNRWTEFIRPRLAARPLSPAAQGGLRIASTLLTFHFVALGWVWFVLPTPQMSVSVLLRLLGIKI